jgi:hypothetical protein
MTLTSNAPSGACPPRSGLLRLSPEEDAIIIAGEGDDDIDETLPADLWFHTPRRKPRSGGIKRLQSVRR